MSIRVNKALATFRNDCEGGITAFTLMVFMLMMLSVGMGVDFMRHEAHRAELQNALDRGVLAAAATSQTVAAYDTVAGYMLSTNLVRGKHSLDVQILSDGNGNGNGNNNNGERRILATASYNMPTYFMKLVGINEIPVQARGIAVEGVNHTELSLVLDISTSMSFNNTGGTSDSRLAVMKDAAIEFVDTVLAADAKKSLSISLIPFAGQVNPGPHALDLLTKNREHGYSDCVDFRDEDFDTINFPHNNRLDQTQFFQFSVPWNQRNGVTFPEVGWGWCPAAGEEEIVYHTNDLQKLTTAINNLNTHEATGTQNGMKWAVSLLHHSSSNLTGRLVSKGEVEPEFAHRPISLNASWARKYVVIMSDGNTTGQYRLKDHLYDTAAERAHWATNQSNDQWNDYNFGFVSTQEARTRFLNQCQAAKDAGIIVFTIGFDLTDGSDAQSDMSACASSEAHFYDVDGLDLKTAFAGIAATMQKLKLVN